MEKLYLMIGIVAIAGLIIGCHYMTTSTVCDNQNLRILDRMLDQ